MSENKNDVLYKEKPKIRFKWHGVDPKGHGCEVPLGICIIFGKKNDDSSLITVSIGIHDGKIIIVFPEGVNSNFGLTADGFMPLMEDVPLPSEVSALLGITTLHPKIKAGIYKASFDPKRGRFSGIALDLN